MWVSFQPVLHRTPPALLQGVWRGRTCSGWQGSVEGTPGMEQAQQNVPGSCEQGAVLRGAACAVLEKGASAAAQGDKSFKEGDDRHRKGGCSSASPAGKWSTVWGQGQVYRRALLEQREKGT